MDDDSEVRSATLDDLDSVWPLARDFATSFQPVRDSFESSFRALVAAKHTAVLVATSGGAVRGYLLAHAHLTFLANGPVVWIEELMVAETHRRAGIGRALMAAAERWAVDEGAAYVSLASRRAGDFYLAVGYEDSATFFKKTL
jgi:GNAT superfamily N-acetyltransferase